MKIFIPIPGIIHICEDTQFDLAFTFMRFQECYEQCDTARQNKYFSLEDVIVNYAKTSPTGRFTYLEDWYGYNFPDIAYNRFKELYKHDYTKREHDLISIIDAVVDEHENALYDGKFYIIGTSSDIYLDHEIAHGMYYLYDEYRSTANKLTKKLPKPYKTAIKETLTEHGYPKNVMKDEINAYLATSSMHYIRNHLLHNLSANQQKQFDWDFIYRYNEFHYDWTESHQLYEREQEINIKSITPT